MSEPDITILLQIAADLPEKLPRERLEAAARQVLIQDGHEIGMLSIVVSTDDHIRELNQKFRGIDAPTDVLSFPSEPLPFSEEESDYLGDIIIGLPYTATRAHEEGRNVVEDVLLLIVHGTLHLLGYDHDTAENQVVMWDKQAQALNALGLHLDIPPYIHD